MKTLPIHLAEANKTAESGNALARILIVDDEAGIRRLITRWASEAGYECADADSAAAAWSSLQHSPFDLVTLDISMPGTSGLEFLSRIVEVYPGTAVLMLTGSALMGTAVDALTTGACGYLTKPFTKNQLLVEILKALQQRRRTTEHVAYLSILERENRQQAGALRAAYEETSQRLVRASLIRDEETGAHIQRTGLFSEILAIAAGWSRANATLLRLAAPMHDIGKIGIPDAILSKAGRLSEQEMNVMKTHTTLGAQMLAGSSSPVLQMAEVIALCHHERWDGTGYPRGLTGDLIPEAARIVAIVDVYDALSNDRVYRPAFSETEIESMMLAGRETHFDPRLLDTFMSLLPEIQVAADRVLCSALLENEIHATMRQPRSPDDADMEYARLRC